MPPDIDAIRRRARELAEIPETATAASMRAEAAEISARDVPMLLDEVDRLAAENRSLRAETVLLGQAVDRLISQRQRSDRAT